MSSSSHRVDDFHNEQRPCLHQNFRLLVGVNFEMDSAYKS